MIAVSFRTGSATPSLSLAGCSSRVHTVDEAAREPVVAESVSGVYSIRHASMRTASTGRLYLRSRSTTRRASRESWLSFGSTAARTAASSSDGVMAISSERSGALTNTRTWRRPASSVVENIPKPPPFHGLSPAVLASVTCAPATASSIATGSAARHATRPFGPARRRRSGWLRRSLRLVISTRPPDIPSTPSCSTSGRTAMYDAPPTFTLVQLVGSVVIIAPAGGSTTWYATSPPVITRV